LDARGYALCGESRAGTTFLKEMLGSTGVLGNPVEWFNPIWQSREEGAAANFLDAMRVRSSTPNGVYGLKIFSQQTERAGRLHWASELPALSFVHIRREDLLGQAISLARAGQTARFTADQGERALPVYDRQLIASALIELARGQARWEIWFARNGVNPLRLSYEEIVAAPETAVAWIAALVGVEEAKVDPAKVPSQIMRDGVSEEWRQRFLADAPSRDRFPGLTDWSANGLRETVRRWLR